MDEIRQIIDAASAVASPFNGIYLLLRDSLNRGTISAERVAWAVRQSLAIVADATAKAQALLEELRRPEAPAPRPEAQG
jgi:hypothetical protein